MGRKPKYKTEAERTAAIKARRQHYYSLRKDNEEYKAKNRARQRLVYAVKKESQSKYSLYRIRTDLRAYNADYRFYQRTVLTEKYLNKVKRLDAKISALFQKIFILEEKNKKNNLQIEKLKEERKQQTLKRQEFMERVKRTQKLFGNLETAQTNSPLMLVVRELEDKKQEQKGNDNALQS